MPNLRRDLTPSDELSLIKKEINIDDLVGVYPEEAINKLIENKDKLKAIAKKFNGTFGSVAKAIIFMKCNTVTCPYRTSCLLIKNNLAPEGYQCPIEAKIAAEIEFSVTKELDIDTHNSIEMELLYDFIDAKLLDMRTSGMLANGCLVQDVHAISEGREVVTSRDISPEFKIKMDLKRLKSSILEDFMATRKAKKRYGINTDKNAVEELVRKAMGQKVG